MNELVSVVIPFYSGKMWLEKAIESVINQNYDNIEIIIVDDGSQESIRSILNKYKQIRYYRIPNSGPGAARNLGITKSNGEYIAFLDSDDLWNQDKLKKQIKYMKEHHLCWSFHNYDYFNEKGIIKTIHCDGYEFNTLKYIYTSFKVQTSCLMVKREALINLECFFFDEEHRIGEDIYLYEQLAKKYNLGILQESLAKFRIRGSNSGFNPYNQIKSRVVLYLRNHNSDYFKANTSHMVRFAYKFTKLTLYIIDKEKIENKYMLFFFYFLPWIIFKISYLHLKLIAFFKD